MRITGEQLITVIEEEVYNYLTELGLCHHPDTGHWAKCEKGAVYSLTTKGAKDNNVDDEYVQRGTVTAKEKRKPPKIKAKFGINTSKKKSAGRKLIDGDDIPPKYSVSKYPEKYKEHNSRYDPNWESSKERKRHDRMGKPDRKRYSWCHGKKELDDLAQYKGLYEGKMILGNDILDIIESAFEGMVGTIEEGDNADACRRMGFVTVSEAQKRILRALNAFAKAQDGKLFDEPKNED